MDKGVNLGRLFHRAFTSSALKVLWDLLARSLNFILSIVIARSLGVEAFGRYAVIWYLAWMASQVTDLGLHLVVLRNLSREEGRARLTAGVVAKMLLTLASLALVLAVAASGAAPEAELTSALLLYAATLVASWTELLGVALRSRGRLGLEGTALTILRVGWLAGAAMALHRGGGIRELAAALALAALPALAFAAVAAGRLVAPLFGRVSPREVRALLGQAAPVALTSVITLVYLRLDVLLLARLQGAEAAGLFTASFRLLEALFLFSGGIVAGSFPLLAAQVGRDRLGTLSSFVLRLLLWVAVPAAAGFLALSDGIIGFLYGAGFAGSAAPLRILAAAVVPIYVNALATHLLVATGRGRTLVALMLARLTVGLALDLSLIPSLGPEGAALAVVGAEGSLAVGALIATRNLLSPKAVASAGLAPVVSSMVMGGVLLLLPAGLPLQIVLGAAVYAAAFLILWKLGGERVLPLRPTEPGRG